MGTYQRRVVYSYRCLEVLIEMQATKIRRTIADIEVLQNAKLTSESRLSNIQEVSDRIFNQIIQCGLKQKRN